MAWNCLASSHPVRLDISTSMLERSWDPSGDGPDRNLVFEALESVDFPESGRANVRQKGDKQPVYGMCLGLTESWTRGPMPSKATRERPRLAELLCCFAKREVPDFHFTSIQVNKDYAATLHVDKNNAGLSRITGLGDYCGGELWIDDGRKGKAFDLQGRWLEFDGNLPHCVFPFRGRRYTLVYFTKISGGDLGSMPTSGHARLLKAFGFPLPLRMPFTRSYQPAWCRLRTARRRLDKFVAREQRRRSRGSSKCVLKGYDRRARLQVRLPCGNVVKVALPEAAPFRLLTTALSKRLKGSSRSNTCPTLHIGSMRLLPSDTAVALGLNSDQDIIDVVMVDAAKY